METNDVKEIVYCLFKLLTDQSSPSTKDLKSLEKIFGPFTPEVSERDWRKIQSMVAHMWRYKDFHHTNWRRQRPYLQAKHFCRAEHCPIKDIATKSEGSDFFNLVVGPIGHLKEGDPSDFIKAILDRLSIVGEVTEAYYYDPYIKEPFENSFTESFLKELKTSLSPLVAVTTKQVVTNKSSVPIFKIPDDLIHDRFVVIYEDNKWKGVSIGNSLNSFPNESNPLHHRKKHFIISKLEDNDAPIVAKIIKDNLITS